MITLIAGFVLIVMAIFRAMNLRSLHKVVIRALDAGSPEVPALIDRLGRRPRFSYRLTAYVLLTIAAAILCIALLEWTPHDFKEVIPAAIFPAFVAVAILIHQRRVDRAGDA